ncbi:MAG: hypothetical protein WCK35_07290 [Chloroflexota bacterium]
MTNLLIIHSINRWMVTLVALALVSRFSVGLIRKQAWDKSATILTTVFGGLLDIQLLLGLMMFVLEGLGPKGFPTYRWEHAVTMLLAVIVAHLTSMWKKQIDSVRLRNTLITVLLSLLLIFIGIGPLGGWVRWWHITGLF